MSSQRKRLYFKKFCSRRVGRVDPKGEKPKRKNEDEHEAQPAPPQPQPQPQEELHEPPPLVISMPGQGQAPTLWQPWQPDSQPASASAEGSLYEETGTAAGPNNEENPIWEKFFGKFLVMP